MKESCEIKDTIVKVKNSHNWLIRDCYFTGVKDGEIYAAIDNTQITPEDHDLLYKRGFIRWASMLECQDVINQRGCSWFTIRLDATKYKPRDSHVKVWRRWKRFLTGERPLKDTIDDAKKDEETHEPADGQAKSKTETPQLDQVKDTEDLMDADVEFETFTETIKQKLSDNWETLVKLALTCCEPEAAKKVKDDFFSNLKAKVTIIHDKIDDRILFTNCLVIITLALSIDPKGFASSHQVELKSLVNVPNFSVEILPSGIIRWVPVDLNPRLEKNKLEHKEGKQKSESSEKPKPRKFEIKWTVQEYTEEAYQLYKLYSDTFQNSYGTSRDYFRENIIRNDIIPREEVSAIDGSVLKLGNYMMKYYLDDELIAFSALDVIPSGFCGAFFIYHPRLRSLKMEVVSARYEIEFIKQMNKSFPEFKYEALGHYIPQTKSSNYKHDYEPSELKCPLTNRYVLLTPALIEQVAAGRKILDEAEYPESERLKHEFRDAEDIYQTLLEHGRLLYQGELHHFKDSSEYSDILRKFANEMTVVLTCVGRELAKRVVFDFDS